MFQDSPGLTYLDRPAGTHGQDDLLTWPCNRGFPFCVVAEQMTKSQEMDVRPDSWWNWNFCPRLPRQQAGGQDGTFGISRTVTHLGDLPFAFSVRQRFSLGSMSIQRLEAGKRCRRPPRLKPTLVSRSLRRHSCGLRCQGVCVLGTEARHCPIAPRGSSTEWGGAGLE